MPVRKKSIKSSSKNLTPNFSNEYKTFLNELKSKILNSRLKAALAVNQEVIKLYWHIDHQIIEKQKMAAWGDKLIETLSNDLRNLFPETSGFSPQSLKRMRMFAEYYPDVEFGSQPVTQLPWGHIQLLLFRVKDKKAREWYAKQCIENDWSRISLEKHVKNNLVETQGNKQNKATNFLKRLPSPQCVFR